MAEVTADINSNARSLAARLVEAVIDRFSPRRAAQRQASVLGEGMIKRLRDLVAARSASVPPPDVPGTGRSWSGHEVSSSIDEKQQRLLSDPEAMRGRAFSRTGPTARAHAQHPAINVDYIARLHTHVERNGWLWDKTDLDARIMREHEHLQPADRARRSWIFQYPPRLLPKNKSKIAMLVRNAVEAVIDEIDGFDSGVSELQIANGSGLGMSELWYRPRRLRIPVGPNRATMVTSECVAGMETVPLRSVACDIDTDRPYVNQGGWGWVDPFVNPVTGDPLRKVIYHKGYGDGDARMRGYMFAAHHLHWLSKLTWEKSATLVEVYGLQTPYLQPQDDGENIRDEDYEAAEGALSRLGRSIPAILSARLGEIKLTPPPGQLTPIHQAMIGFCNTGLSKLITGQTLSMEVGNVGSYAAQSGHADQQEGVQRIDASYTCGTLNAQLLRFIVELNAGAWAYAFAPYSEGEECTPETILASVPRLRWPIGRSQTQKERLEMFVSAAAEGLSIDEGQVYDEMNFRPALDAGSAFGAKRTAQPGLQEPQRPAPPAPDPAPGDAPPTEGEPLPVNGQRPT